MQRQLLFAVAIAAIIGLVIGSVLSSESGISCEDWQRQYTQAQEDAGSGVFAFINEGPFAERIRELERQKPENCPAS